MAFHETQNGQKRPAFSTILRGQSLVGDVYIERIPVDKIDTSSDDTVEKFLLDVYRQKVSNPGRGWTLS